MRRKHWATGAAVAALGFLAAACGTTDGTGASPDADVQSPKVQVVAMSPTPVVDSGTVAAGPLGAMAQRGPDVGLVLGRSDALQQDQVLQQGAMIEQSSQATTTASDQATLFCG